MKSNQIQPIWSRYQALYTETFGIVQNDHHTSLTACVCDNETSCSGRHLGRFSLMKTRLQSNLEDSSLDRTTSSSRRHKIWNKSAAIMKGILKSNKLWSNQKWWKMARNQTEFSSRDFRVAKIRRVWSCHGHRCQSFLFFRHGTFSCLIIYDFRWLMAALDLMSWPFWRPSHTIVDSSICWLFVCYKGWHRGDLKLMA